MLNRTFHHGNDGLGPRKVTVNGNEIDQVVWADIARGVLVYVPSPVRPHKNKRGEVYSRRLRGKIEVTFIEGK